MLSQLFLDDNERNIAAGKALGLRTALVNYPTLLNPSLALIYVEPQVYHSSFLTSLDLCCV
jgi:FMN phosphatase YigB (HAD superfamily)